VLVSEKAGLRGDGTCVQLEDNMVVCKNCDSPKSSNDQVTDDSHKLVFVMCSADAQEVSTSEVVLDCSIDEVGMEQLEQVAV
jgi:hypothetical protein